MYENVHTKLVLVCMFVCAKVEIMREKSIEQTSLFYCPFVMCFGVG